MRACCLAMWHWCSWEQLLAADIPSTTRAASSPRMPRLTRGTYCAVKHMAAAIVKDINLYPGFVQGELIKTASGPNYDNERAKGRAATWCGRAARS